MYRQSPPRDPELEALLDERDDLQIRISLEADCPKADPDRLHQLSLRLAHVENQIFQHQKHR